MTTLTPEDRARLRDLAHRMLETPVRGAASTALAEGVTALLDALDEAEAELATERQAASAAREVMDRHRCDEQAERAYRRAERAEAAVQRVRDLHTPRVEEAITGDCAEEECDHDGPCPTTPFTVCAECWRIAEESDVYFSERGIHAVLYPCPTMRALDGAA